MLLADEQEQCDMAAGIEHVMGPGWVVCLLTCPASAV